MIFGTCDPLEEKHHILLSQAAAHGDGVMVVLSRDDSDHDSQDVLTMNEYERLAQLMHISIVDDVILEHDSKIEIMRTHQPDIILLGAHQEDIAEELHEFPDILHACGCVIVYV